MMKVRLHKGQIQVAKDDHRFRVIDAGRRWGKSVLARMIMLQWATAEVGTYWIVSPSYKQSKMIHWREMQKEVPKAWIKKKNEVELSIELKNGSIIELKGADNPDSLRGVKLRGLIVDEISSIRNWVWLWQEVLRATLTDYASPAVFISTPQGYDHFYDLYQLGQQSDNDYMSWRFTSYDNPFIPAEEIDKAKLELTEDAFMQEYMADFRTFVGLVYKDFDRMVHVVPDDTVINPAFWIMGHDVGFTNPRAVPFIAVDQDGIWWQADELYKPGLTNPQAYEAIKGMMGKGRNYDLKTMDSAHASDIKELADLGLDFLPVKKESGELNISWIQYKIRKFSERLKKQHYFVFERCKNTIAEFEAYRYPEDKVDQSKPETPLKVNDHMMDAIGDLNAMYLHYYEEKKQVPWAGKIKGTYIEPSPVYDDDYYGDDGQPDMLVEYLDDGT